MNNATRKFIEATLKSNNINETHKICVRTLDEYVSIRTISMIRKEMVTAGEIDVEPSIAKRGDPVSGNFENSQARISAERGCERLREAMELYYYSSSIRNQCSVLGARMAALYSHEELLRMAAVGN